MLKQLIQRLLDSRTTPAQAAHSAMPSSSYVTVIATAVQAWGEMAKGVATFDGFVRVSARATSSNANVRVTNDTPAMFSQTEATASGQTQGVFVPVAKGDSWSVYGTNRDNVVVRLVKTVGGGYNILVWRAVLCLKPSFNYSLRNFLRISLSGLADKHFHPAGSTSLLPSHSMFRQVTASWDFISRLITLTKRLTYTPMAPAEALSLVPRFQRRQRTATQSLEQSPLRKVTVLLSAVHSLSYGSHQRWEANSNLSTGGALC